MQPPKSLGEVTDGVTLKELRHAPRGSGYRFVFEFEGEVVPRTEVRLAPDGTAIEVMLSGVRHDATGHRPLRREDGSAFGRPVQVDFGVIQSFGRQLVLDDSAVSYRIELAGAVSFELNALPGPARVVIDVEPKAAQ